MPNYQIPITYVVSASAVTPGKGLEPLKISTILLLTEDEPVTPLNGAYMISRTSNAVAQQFGTETETAKQAQIIFSQQPNILANDGYLIVAPYLASATPAPIPATAGTLTTPVLTANIDNFAKVVDGAFSITVDGTEKDITGLDFAQATTLEEIASIIQEALTDVTVTVDNDSLVFTSNTTGTSSSVEIGAATNGTDLTETEYLDIVNATTTTGTAEIIQPARPETLAEAITRLAGELYFQGILTTRSLSDDEAINASNLVQSMQNRVFPLPVSKVNALQAQTGLFAKILPNFNTKGLLYTYGDTADQAALNSRLFAAAYLSRGLSVNYNGSNTTITMNLKDLVGIQADTNISETILNQCQALGVDCFPSIEGLAKIISNRQGTMYFDQVVNQIWFVNAIQRAVFNTLATVRTKIPQTEAGLEQLATAIRGVCKQAVTNGYLAPGTWNSPETFGDYDDFLRNITEFGYYQYHQPVAEQLQSEREQRKAPFWQIAGKEAGAVHSASILIYIEA